ncbi:sialate O-acetylesterase [Desertivirga xinjiangensis]|uniref:sialate O-acetylesterase n=1 Tax=Desertivirga xinjiangensis TaxID=539206 RepID=UPI00210CD822|nr:sialate O-acetylesterase [Pedobacter xinjiangensis]
MLKKTFIFLLLLPLVSAAQIILPPLLSDNMVLQRDQALKIWGWASPGEELSLTFNGFRASTKVLADSTWEFKLPAMQAGGPYDLELKGTNEKNRLKVYNILIGDVWLCSGQSNMDYQLHKSSDLYKADIKASLQPEIREFAVKSDYGFRHKKYAEGSWKEARPENVMRFSAVGYFFALELYKKYKIPIGIIHSSYPGTPAESWISAEGLKEFPPYRQKADLFKDSAYTHKIVQAQKRISADWLDVINKLDEGSSSPQRLWKNNISDLKDWHTISFPGFIEDQAEPDFNGVLWIKKKVHIPARMTQSRLVLELGLIDDIDSTYINGVNIGSRDNKYLVRKYQIPPGLLKEGENWITLRIVDKEGKCGIVQGKSYQIRTEDPLPGDAIDLSGEWLYKVGYRSAPLPSEKFVSIDKLPEIMYYSKIEPLIKYAIRGVAWYQGESNTSKYSEYKELLASLINDWRNKWQLREMPFLIVQLANYMDPPALPSASDWALLREAQAKLAREVSNSGLAVAIDFGEQYDIHPANKKDVGRRLALVAREVAYGDSTVISSGPVYRSMSISKNKIDLYFDKVGDQSGDELEARNGALKHFAIAGEDKVFHWAKAKIKNGRVQVWSKKVKQPVAVRYAWADNPQGCNLYNKSGLPASPFRTDQW